MYLLDTLTAVNAMFGLTRPVVTSEMNYNSIDEAKVNTEVQI
jgi:hypothetical protein